MVQDQGRDQVTENEKMGSEMWWYETVHYDDYAVVGNWLE